MAGSAPVIMTLTSRPAWANDCTISAMMSANLSRPNRTAGCEGGSTTYWLDSALWSATGFIPGTPKGDSGCYQNDGTHFHFTSDKGDGFGTGGGSFGTLSLMQVLRLEICPSTQGEFGTVQSELGRQAVAALLNAADPNIDFGYAWGEIVDIYNARASTDPTGLTRDLEMLNSRGV